MRAWIAVLSLVGVAIVATGCGDDDGPRRGGLGESCRATDDCESPLVCRANVCSDGSVPDAGMDAAEPDAARPPDAGRDTGGPVEDAGETDGGTDAGADSGEPTDGGPINACDECLESECGMFEEACDSECVAVEACIQMVCGNLSVIGSADEGMCQVTCQNAHLTGRPRHLDVVNCVIDADCPSCGIFPDALLACRERMTMTSCSDELATCDASTPCLEYRNCVSQCTTVTECNACDDDNFAGRMIAETLERCIAAECVAEGWVP